MNEKKEKLPVIIINGRRRRKKHDSEYTGQPSKYQIEFDSKLIDHLSQGYSFHSFSSVLFFEYGIKISTQTLYNWCDRFPDFKLAKEVGESCGLKLYESLLRALATGLIPNDLKIKGAKKLNIKSIMFILSTRFHKTYPTNNQRILLEEKSANTIQINIESGEENL